MKGKFLDCLIIGVPEKLANVLGKYSREEDIPQLVDSLYV